MFKITSSSTIPACPNHDYQLPTVTHAIEEITFNGDNLLQARIEDGSRTGCAVVYRQDGDKISKQIYQGGITRYRREGSGIATIVTLPRLDQASGQLLVLDSQLGVSGTRTKGLSITQSFNVTE